MQQIWRALKGPSRLDGSCPEALFPLAPSCFFLRFPSGWMEWSGAAYSSRRGHGAKWHHLPSPKLAPQPISGAQTEARPSVSQHLGHGATPMAIILTAKWADLALKSSPRRPSVMPLLPYVRRALPGQALLLCRSFQPPRALESVLRVPTEGGPPGRCLLALLACAREVPSGPALAWRVLSGRGSSSFQFKLLGTVP